MKKLVFLTLIFILVIGCNKNNQKQEMTSTINTVEENEILVDEKDTDDDIVKDEILDSNIEENIKEIKNINIDFLWPEVIPSNTYIVKKNKELFLYSIDNKEFIQITNTNSNIYDFDFSLEKQLLVFTVSIKNDYIKFFDEAEKMNGRKVPTRLYVADFNNKTLKKMIHLNNESFVNNNKDYSWNKWVCQGIHIFGFHDELFYYNLNYLSYFNINNNKSYQISDKLNSFISEFKISKTNIYVTYSDFEGEHQRLYDYNEGKIKEDNLTLNEPLRSYVGGSKIIGIIDDNTVVIKKTPNNDMDFSGHIQFYDAINDEVIDERYFNDVRRFSVYNNKLVSFIDPFSDNNGHISGVDKTYKLWEIDNDNKIEILNFSFLPFGHKIFYTGINSINKDIIKFYGYDSDNVYGIYLFNNATKALSIINDLNGSNFLPFN